MSGSPARGQVPQPRAATDLPALHDALDGLSLAAFIAEDGDRECVSQALMEASFAATSAFPPGTPEADALNVIFTAISRAVPGTEPPSAGMSEPELGD